MDVKAQIAAVIDLDHCLGCRGCDVACKAAWNHRPGMQHAWWHHTESVPGPGLPARSRNRPPGGWVLNDGRLRLANGSRAAHLLSIVHQQDLSELDDFGEPWRFALEGLSQAGEGLAHPPAFAQSTVTGLGVSPGPRPDLGRGPGFTVAAAQAAESAPVTTGGIGLALPRLCSHCLNPPCVAACPSGAAYKREEDGIVLIDQQGCRGWRSCVPACPYGKVDVNWITGKSEKCHLCYPVVEQGRSPFCFSSCPGHVRYLGVLLYDAERIAETASLSEELLVEGLQGFFLDPQNPAIQSQARRCGIAPGVLEASRRSPVHLLISQARVALPLHSEYRTLPAVFYLPPLDPAAPMKELARLLAAGREGPLVRSLRLLRRVRRTDAGTGPLLPGESAPAAPAIPEHLERALDQLLNRSRLAERVVVPLQAEASSPKHRGSNL